MNFNTKDIIAYTKKTVVFLIAIIYRSACEHPFLLGMVSFLLLLYRFLPHMFGFLVSSSPIIVCTTLLLGVLLSFGQPNIPEIGEQETTHGSSPLQMRAISSDPITEEDESFSIGRHIENREMVEETAIKEGKFTAQVDYGSKSERGALLSASNEEEERESEASVDAGLPIEVDKKRIHTENIATNRGAVENRGHIEKAEIHVSKLLADGVELTDHAFLATSGQTEAEVLKVETHEPAVEGQFDSSLVSSWKLTDNQDASESDSDRAESSSPDASMADIIPMLDELHPLLDSEDPQPVNAPMDDLHSMSGESTEHGESDDGSGEEEAENQGEGVEEEEEEEAKEENEDGAVLAVKWTEDDAKNLLVLGTSELERNQRLENLIAKRRARKNLSVDVEMNLIDLDVHETRPMVDELSRVQMQIPPISTARRNPFDLPYDSDPIPGSAPSVLLPRRNPFDLPLDQVDEGGGLPGVSHQGSVAVPQREMFFRRHESFAIGASFTGEFKQEKHDVKLRPYFVTERTGLAEASYAHFQRQLSEKSDSKVSSFLESESISSVADQDYDDELSEQQLHRESESELVSSSTNDAKHVERECNSDDDDVDSVDSLCRRKEISIHGSHDIGSTTSEVLGSSIHGAIDDFIKHEEQNRHDLDLCSPISQVSRSDEEKYSRSNSSCSLESSMKNLSTKSEIGSTDHQLPSVDSLKGSSGSGLSVSGEVEAVNDRHVVEPVYDSSPSAIEKSLSNIASLEEELLHGDKASFKSTSSLSSETLIETSGIGSPPVLAEGNIFLTSVSSSGSMGKMPASDNGELWVAPPNLFSVEENESRSREVGMIREQDVIQVEFTEVNDEYDHPTASSLPESAIEQILCYSSSSLTATDSSEDSATDVSVDLQFSEQENVVEAPHSDVPGTSSYFNSQVPANAEPPVESSIVQSSFDTSLVEQLVKMPENGDALAFLPGVNIPDSTSGDTDVPRQVEGVELPILTQKMEIIEGEWSNKCSNDSKEVVKKQENGLQEDVNGSGVSYVALASVEEIRSIDDEVLLSELDVIGDFHIEEMRLNDSRNETIYQYQIIEKKIGEESSFVKSETGKSEVLFSEAHLGLVESSRDLQEVEARSLEDIHMALKHASEDTVGDLSKPMETKFILEPQEAEARTFEDLHMQVSEGTLVESSRQPGVFNLQDVEARSLEDIHMALKHASEGTAGDPSKPLETKFILEPQEAEARTSENLHMQVSEGTLEESSRQPGVFNLQDVEARSIEDIHVASEHSEGTNDSPPKLTQNKNDSSVIEATDLRIKGSLKGTEVDDTSHVEEVEARSLADIDVALKHAREGTTKVGYIEVEATESNLDHCTLEAQTSEEIELAGAVDARATDQHQVQRGS